MSKFIKSKRYKNQFVILQEQNPNFVDCERKVGITSEERYRHHNEAGGDLSEVLLQSRFHKQGNYSSFHSLATHHHPYQEKNVQETMFFRIKNYSHLEAKPD